MTRGAVGVNGALDQGGAGAILAAVHRHPGSQPAREQRPMKKKLAVLIVILILVVLASPWPAR